MNIHAYDIQDREWAAPKIPEGETLEFDEPGRVLDRKAVGGNTNVCYRSYWFRVTRAHGALTLRVRHGGGEESQPLGYTSDALYTVLGALDSNARYFVLWELYDAWREGAKRAQGTTEARYRQAFVDGRLKKRKLRGQNLAKVWIEPAPAVSA